MTKPRLLDLFCGAGGAAMGYARAGFEVVGVDINPQPHYPFEFHQADALEFVRALIYGGVGSDRGRLAIDMFDVIHASPPCQAYSRMTRQFGDPANHPDLVEPTRAALAGRRYVIENVEGAPLIAPVRLCGTSFGLAVRRHRLFEMSDPPALVPPCNHFGHRALQVTGNPGGHSRRDPGAHFGDVTAWRDGMGIDWMTGRELAEAIPPAYTEWIGTQLLAAIEAAA